MANCALAVMLGLPEIYQGINHGMWNRTLLAAHCGVLGQRRSLGAYKRIVIMLR